jgi:hypothetical protein
MQGAVRPRIAHARATPQIKPGDVLVSNFNNSAGVQGTGTTIIFFSPTREGGVAQPGSANTFFMSKLAGVAPGRHGRTQRSYGRQDVTNSLSVYQLPAL